MFLKHLQTTLTFTVSLSAFILKLGRCCMNFFSLLYVLIELSPQLTHRTYIFTLYGSVKQSQHGYPQMNPLNIWLVLLEESTDYSFKQDACINVDNKETGGVTLCKTKEKKKNMSAKIQALFVCFILKFSFISSSAHSQCIMVAATCNIPF